MKRVSLLAVSLIVICCSLLVHASSLPVLAKQPDDSVKSTWAIFAKNARTLLGLSVKEIEALFGDRYIPEYRSAYWFGPQKLVSVTFALNFPFVLVISFENGYVSGYSVKRHIATWH